MKQVVIIGGGFAGSSLAKRLEQQFTVTLIDTKDYFEFTPGILRTIVEPDHAGKIQILHHQYLKRTTIIVAEVQEVTATAVILGQRKIEYDYLVICSGSRYSLPIKEHNVILATRAEHLQKNSEQLKKAKKVLIVGGGLVGVELAAEICTYYPNKETIIVHAQQRLIERNPEKARNIVSNFLQRRGVKIIVGEKVQGMDAKKKAYLTNKGTKVEADLVFMCTGIIPNSEFMAGDLKQELDEKKYIRVNHYLQLRHHHNIFAVGDVNNLPVEKTAQNAEIQAGIAAKNIIALEEQRKLTEYKVKVTPLVVSLGKWNGLFISQNIIFSGIIAGLLKNIVEYWFMLKMKWKI